MDNQGLYWSSHPIGSLPWQDLYRNWINTTYRILRESGIGLFVLLQINPISSHGSASTFYKNNEHISFDHETQNI